MKYAGWLVVGLLVGAACMWLADHWSLVQNREKISGAGQVADGLGKIFGGV